MSNHKAGDSPRLFPKWRIIWGPLLVFLFGVFGPIGRGDDPKKDKPNPPKSILKGKDADEVVRLRREVDALESLYHLEPTEAQLAGLLKLAEQTGAKPKPAVEAVAGADYRAALREFRNALAKEDEEKVDELNEKLAELNEKEPTRSTIPSRSRKQLAKHPPPP